MTVLTTAVLVGNTIHSAYKYATRLKEHVAVVRGEANASMLEARELAGNIQRLL